MSTISSRPLTAATKKSSTLSRFWTISPYDKILALAWIAAVVMVTAMFFVAAPLGHLLHQ